jgi:DNA-binding response OmpR family regulator
MDQSSTPPKAQPIEQSFTPPAHSKLILLVEDDENLAKVYLMRFKAEGFEIKRVNNGEDALAAATQYHPDLILLDVMMPRVNGFDVLDILRNTPETANMKVIMLTALGQESDRKKAESLGVDDYLVKSEVVLNDIVLDIKRVLST